MAARAQRPMGPQGTRSKGAMRTPPLRTASNDIQPQTRYSFMETPVEMERSTFQPYHQFSSPTNSTIDESPISPASPGRGLPTYPQIPHTITTSSLPVEKAQTQSPQEMHPAFYVPYQEAQPAQQQPAQQPPHTQMPAVPESPGPIPLKFQEVPHHHARETTITEFLPPPTSEEEEPKAGMGSHNTIYNPDSLQGPNVDLERTHRPGQVSHPNSNVEPHWKNGLCEPDTLCCMGLVCPCMVYGKTMYRLSRKAQKQDPTDLLGYERCNGSCGFMAAACGFQWILAAIHRTRIRKLYHLEGGFGTDCVKSLCCCCCVIMQNEREVRDREELIRRHAGPVNGAYVSPNPMSYAPPPR